MNKSKKALIIATVILIIGIIGSILTGTYAKNQVESNILNSLSMEKEIATFTDDIETIYMDFNCQHYSVLFRESKDELLHVKTYKGFENTINLDKGYDDKAKQLSLVIPYGVKAQDLVNTKEGIKDIITKGIIESLNLSKQLIIEVPKAVNIDFVNLGNQDSDFIVEEASVLKDRFSSKSSIVNIKLPYFNNLKSIYIDSNNEVNLDMREIVNVNKVVLKGTKVNIYSEGKISDYDANKVPEKVDIFAKTFEGNSFIPFGKKVNIEASDWTDLIMSFDKYNISGRIGNGSTEPMQLNNLKFRLEGGGVYEGKYSLAKGEKYEMNISTYNGKLTNADFDTVKYTASEDSNVLDYKRLDNSEFIQASFDAIKNIIWQAITLL